MGLIKIIGANASFRMLFVNLLKLRNGLAILLSPSGAFLIANGETKKAVISIIKEITAFPMRYAFLFSQLRTY